MRLTDPRIVFMFAYR